MKKILSKIGGYALQIRRFLRKRVQNQKILNKKKIKLTIINNISYK